MTNLNKKAKMLAEKLGDNQAVRSFDEALKLLRELKTTKFDETVEVALNLGVDPRHADQMVRGMVSLPSGTGKDVKVAVFARGENAEKALAAGAPWRAGARLEVISTLDLPAWAVLVGLLDECPVMHAAIGASRGAKPHRVSATAFEFISDTAQIDAIHEFLAALPATLSG